MDSGQLAQANALPAAESVAARRAYNRRAHSEHPGVTVLALNRRDRTKIALRYLDPRDGKRHQCERLTDSGEPWPYSESEKTSLDLPAIASREAAKALARQLSGWLKLQKSVHQLKAAGVAFDPSPVTPLIPFAGEQISWTELKARHELKLAAQGCSGKTKETYASHWRHFMAWGKPAWPSELREAHLQAFAHGGLLTGPRTERSVAARGQTRPYATTFALR